MSSKCCQSHSPTFTLECQNVFKMLSIPFTNLYPGVSECLQNVVIQFTYLYPWSVRMFSKCCHPIHQPLPWSVRMSSKCCHPIHLSPFFLSLQVPDDMDTPDTNQVPEYQTSNPCAKASHCFTLFILFFFISHKLPHLEVHWLS
ncbi:hypothetical protein Btru_064185 [Bulinus truncatus]|nr:hypothetical protein Btru_064185 [Bulinus truncatus]